MTDIQKKSLTLIKQHFSSVDKDVFLELHINLMKNSTGPHVLIIDDIENFKSNHLNILEKGDKDE